MEETIGYEALIPSEDRDALGRWDDASHTVTITYDAAKNKAAYALDCESCGPVGSADDEGLAKLLARFHEVLETTIVAVGR